MSIKNMKNEMKNHLTERLIPFWNKLRDDEHGGFYGYVGSDYSVDKSAVKGIILHARILWFYANCKLVLGDEECLEQARHAYTFLTEKGKDKEQGGYFWDVSADGAPHDTMKHVYCQAFVVYALSSYYDASGDEAALAEALALFGTIEEKGRDGVGYLEAMSREWQVVENDALSENGIDAEKTMNTALHLLEAYTELYRVSRDTRVLDRLGFLTKLTYEKIYDSKGHKLHVFFDKEMQVRGDIHSYGHDIEATWLVDRAFDVIGYTEMFSKIGEMNHNICENIIDTAYDGEALCNERDGAAVDETRVWWVQAEAVVGFVNAYQRYQEEKFLLAAESIWGYIKDKVIDKNENGEWYAYIEKNGAVMDFPVVDPWKCPYHNGRMCLEILTRRV